jgi:hypothetical protein
MRNERYLLITYHISSLTPTLQYYETYDHANEEMRRPPRSAGEYRMLVHVMAERIGTRVPDYGDDTQKETGAS